MTDAGYIDLMSIIMGGVTGLGTSTEPYVPLAYPLQIPSVSGVASISWARDEVRGISESPFTYHRQIFKHFGERWRVNITLPMMSEENAGQWRSFLLLLDGGWGTFQFGDFFNVAPKGKAWGSPVCAADNVAGKVLLTKGWNSNITGVLKAGDKIQLNSRLYEITRDTNSDGIGLATLDIWPRLRTVPAEEDFIITQNPRGIFQLDQPGGELFSMSYQRIGIMPSFEIIEAL